MNFSLLKTFLYLISIVIFLGFSKNLYAHNNTMISYRIFFKFDGKNLTDIGESWTLDIITSQELLLKYNLSENKKLNKKDSIKIAKDIMQDLYELRYFTYIKVDNKDLGVIKASGFKAQLTNGNLTIAFNNHLPSPIDMSKKNLSVEVKDVEDVIITDLAEKKPVLLLGAPKDFCKIDIKENWDKNSFDKSDTDIVSVAIPPKQINLICKKE